MHSTLSGKFILIGSEALKLQDPFFPRINPNSDIDLVTTEETFIANIEFFDKWTIESSHKVYAFKKGVRFEIVLRQDHPLFNCSGKGVKVRGFEFEELVICSINCLYSLKKSHITAPIHWDKSIFDYTYLKKAATGWADDALAQSVYQYESNNVEKRTFAKLKMAKNEFFDQHKVFRLFDHDTLHWEIKRKQTPMFAQILENGQEVFCSQEKWNLLSQEDKDLCVREEAEVIALERILLRPDVKEAKSISVQDAYQWALMRICTTLTSGWFRQYAIDRYFEVLEVRSSLTEDVSRLLVKAVYSKSP